MSSLPIVAVTATIRHEAPSPAVRLRATYVAALANARLVPVVTPPGPPGHASDLVARVDGLVLTGGEDVDPAWYGATPHARLGPVARDRDAWELALVRAARAARLPTLAVCRGVQVLNVAAGGTLVQDLPSECPGAIDHDPEHPRETRTHAITLDPASRTARAVGGATIRVNSVHHQALDRAAADFHVVATAPDGVIEGIEPRDRAWWCIGVQWHPEDLIGGVEEWDRALFAGFADAVRAHRAGRDRAD